MLGQLIDEDYILRIATEINEKLAQAGEINISDLTVMFDLPSDFLQHNIVEKHLGKIIRGRQDPSNSRVFFTQSYILRCKSKIRGALAAITRPTPISVILQQIRVQERIFHSIVEEISPFGTVTSKLQSAQYIPHIYAKMQVTQKYNYAGCGTNRATSQKGCSSVIFKEKKKSTHVRKCTVTTLQEYKPFFRIGVSLLER